MIKQGLLIINLLIQLAFIYLLSAEIAQLGERQTEDLKVPDSIPGFGTFDLAAKPNFFGYKYHVQAYVYSF